MEAPPLFKRERERDNAGNSTFQKAESLTYFPDMQVTCYGDRETKREGEVERGEMETDRERERETQKLKQGGERREQDQRQRQYETTENEGEREGERDARALYSISYLQTTSRRAA